MRPDTPPDSPSDIPPGADACITCGDVAVELEVIEIDRSDALCRAADGGVERVAIDLVRPVSIGERLLVHAAVAISKVG